MMSPRNSTQTRSASMRTTARSCEMNSMAMPRSAFRRCRSARMLACTETSSADRISSQSSSDGSATRPRAMATRWRSPPDSSSGKRAAYLPSSLTSARAASTLSGVGSAEEELERPRQRLGDAGARIERGVGVLEDELDQPALFGRAVFDVPGELLAGQVRCGPRSARSGRRSRGPGSTFRCRIRRPARRSRPCRCRG